MNAEVIKGVGTLSIRWSNAGGELWTVTKKFSPGTRILESATIDHISPSRFDSADEGREAEHELHYANGLAETMDRVFIHPEDFDLVAVDSPDSLGYPALIFPPNHHDGKIYIAIA